MLRFLSILFLAGVILELASIIWVGSKIGVVPTILLLFGSGIVGVSLFRSAGANAAAVLRSSIQTQSLIESLAGATFTRIIAGVLFLVPGFLSDIAGLLLLFLPMHRWMGVKAHINVDVGPISPGNDKEFGQIIEGEAVEIAVNEAVLTQHDQKP